MDFFFAVASPAAVSSATLLVATSATIVVASPTNIADPLPRDSPAFVVDYAAILGSGCGAVAVFGTCCTDDGGPPATDLPLWSTFFLLYRGMSSFNESSMSLGRGQEPDLEADPIGTTFPFPLPEFGTMSTLLLALASSLPGMHMPQDGSLLYRVVILMLSSMGISLSSTILASWFKQISAQSSNGVVKPLEDGSVLSFDSIIISVSGSRIDRSPCCKRVVSFTLVYSHTGRERS
jgi:hypothetical protein